MSPELDDRVGTSLEDQIRAYSCELDEAQGAVTVDQIDRLLSRNSTANLTGGRLAWAIAAALALTALVAGALVLSPGDDSNVIFAGQPDIDTVDPGAADTPRIVLSPLVDLQTRLIDSADTEVFTVQSPIPEYWRLTALDVFDGRIWRSRGSFETASGTLDSELPNDVISESVTQRFEVKRLGGIWLPAAYEPAEVSTDDPDVTVEYARESGTLIVNRDRREADGLAYTVVSNVPVRDPDRIARSPIGRPVRSARSLHRAARGLQRPGPETCRGDHQRRVDSLREGIGSTELLR